MTAPDTREVAATLISNEIDVRLDRIEASLDAITAVLVGAVEMLDGFARRAEPLLQMAEKRAARTNVFARKPGGN